MLTRKNLFLILLICIFGLFSFWYVFKVGIYCDDILSAHNFVAYGTSIRSIFSPYGGQNLSMRFLYSLFGLNSGPYFIVLFVIRLFSSFFVYLLARKFSNNKTVGVLTCLLYIFGYAGVGTSDYAILANIPISISFLFLSFTLYIGYTKKLSKSSSVESLTFFTVICILFTISLVVATVRINALVFFFPLVEFILIIAKKSTFKSSFCRLFIFGIFILILKHLGSFGGDSAYHIKMIEYGISQEFASFSVFAKSIYYNVAIIGDVISPPALDSLVLGFFNFININFLISSGLFIPQLSLIAAFIYHSQHKKVKHNKITLLIPVLFILYLLGFYMLFGKEDVSIYQTGNTLFGALFVYTIVLLIIRLYKSNNNKAATILLLSLLWEPMFMTTTYLFSPRTFAFETFASYPIWMQESYVHYYFVPALGIYFLLAYLLTIFTKYKYLYFMLLILILFANALSVREFFYYRLPFRSNEVLSAAINNINNEISESYKNSQTPIVYFTSVDDNTWYFPYVISQWGFGQYEYSLVNNRPDITPIFVTDKENLNKILDQTESLNNLYAFKIENGQVFSQTRQFKLQFSQLQK